jgi:hypothetical protein
MRKGPPLIRAGLLFLLLLGSLTVVVWRQSQALEMLRALDSVRSERALAESQRAGLARRIERLESRVWVSEAASSRLDMRLPSGREIVILPMMEPSAPALAVRDGEAGRSTRAPVRAVAAGEGG